MDHNIDLFRRHTLPGEPVTVTQGNALDLSFLGDDQYDLTLLLGPLYHLYREEDKLRALREAIRVTPARGDLVCGLCDLGRLPDGRGLSPPEHRCAGIYPERPFDKETFAAHSQPKDLFELVRKEMWTG